MNARKQRLTVEVDPADEPLLREVKIAALRGGLTLRQWVMAALREKLERTATTT